MSDRTFDPTTMIAAAREAFAPVLKAQQEGFKAVERLARLQYAFAGDVLESGLARVHAAFHATSPTELLNKQTELTTQFAEKVRARTEEFASFTNDVQSKITQLGSEIASKAVPSKKAA
jgi:phasin family protein